MLLCFCDPLMLVKQNRSSRQAGSALAGGARLLLPSVPIASVASSLRHDADDDGPAHRRQHNDTTTCSRRQQAALTRPSCAPALRCPPAPPAAPSAFYRLMCDTNRTESRCRTCSPPMKQNCSTRKHKGRSIRREEPVAFRMLR